MRCYCTHFSTSFQVCIREVVSFETRVLNQGVQRVRDCKEQGLSSDLVSCKNVKENKRKNRYTGTLCYQSDTIFRRFDGCYISVWGYSHAEAVYIL